MPPAPSPPRGRLGRLADLAFRRRRAVVAVWVVGLVAAFRVDDRSGLADIHAPTLIVMVPWAGNQNSGNAVSRADLNA